MSERNNTFRSMTPRKLAAAMGDDPNFAATVTNALALDSCCDVPRSTAVDYSTAQQLITTAWNIILAIVLAALQLLGFPFGTIFGIYVLWVMLNKDTERLFSSTP